METNTTRTIPLGRAGKYGSLTVDCSRFNDAVHDHVYTYGLRQILNDAIADKTDDEGNPLPVADLIAKSQRRLDALYAGELRVRGEAAEPVDPVDAEVYRMAKAKLTELVRDTSEYKTLPKGTKDRALEALNVRRLARGGQGQWSWTEMVADYEAKVPGIRKAAQRIVRERAAAGEIEI